MKIIIPKDEDMRKKRLMYNTLSSVVFQIVGIICSFILPRIILESFGSEVNGLVNSITQFLSVISFLDLGVGSVVRSSLYKPLANQDNDGISRVVASGEKFFRNIARIMAIYIVVLVFIYPNLINGEFDFLYTATLILAMSISTLAQYYFGIVNRMLLTADQKGYIQYNAQTVTLILNTVACIIFMKMGASIQVVKLTTSLIFASRALYLRWYVDKHYAINRKIKYEGEPIKQKWNGMSQHIASVVLDGTDAIVLSLFATLSDVSIYSVYYLVVNGVKKILFSVTTGFQSLLGELWAKQEQEELRDYFGWIEWGVHTGVVFVYGCVQVLILPFVQVYTSGITDVNYKQPLFATLIVMAYACFCLRFPYGSMIFAAGHYKETQRNYAVATLINIFVSVITVNLWGLIGVALGTLVAMLYQTICLAWYCSKHLIKWPFIIFLKHLITDGIMVGIGVFVCGFIKLEVNNYIDWFVMSVLVALIWGIVIIIMNTILYRDKMKRLGVKLKRIFYKRK